MRLLDIVAGLNANKNCPNFDDLLKHYCNSKTTVEYNIQVLRKKDYLEGLQSNDNEWGYAITVKGKSALDRHLSRVNFFVSSLLETCENGTIDDLYRMIEDQRELL